MGIIPWPVAALFALPRNNVSPRAETIASSFSTAFSVLIDSVQTDNAASVVELTERPKDLFVTHNHTRILAGSIPIRLRNVSVLVHIAFDSAGGENAASLLMSLREAESLRQVLRQSDASRTAHPRSSFREVHVEMRFIEPSDLSSNDDRGSLLMCAAFEAPLSLWGSLNDAHDRSNGNRISPRRLFSLQSPLAPRPSLQVHCPLSTHSALLRFFDCQFFPPMKVIAVLFSSLETWIPPLRRRQILQAVVSRRRRDRQVLVGTPMADIVSFSSHRDWASFTATAAGIAEALHAVFPSLRDAFTHLVQQGAEDGKQAADASVARLSTLIPWLCSPPIIAMLGAILAEFIAASSVDLSRGVGVVSPRAVAEYLSRMLLPGLSRRIEFEQASFYENGFLMDQCVHNETELSLRFEQFAVLFASNETVEHAAQNISASVVDVPVIASKVHASSSGDAGELVDDPTHFSVLNAEGSDTSGQLARALLRLYHRAALGKLTLSEVAAIGHWVPLRLLDEACDVMNGLTNGPRAELCLSVSAENTLHLRTPLEPKAVLPLEGCDTTLKDESADEAEIGRGFSLTVPHGVVLTSTTRNSEGCYFEVRILETAPPCSGVTLDMPRCAICVAAPQLLIGGTPSMVMALPAPTAAAPFFLGLSEGRLGSAWVLLYDVSSSTRTAGSSLRPRRVRPGEARGLDAYALVISSEGHPFVVACNVRIECGDTVGVATRVLPDGTVSVAFSSIGRRAPVSPLASSNGAGANASPPFAAITLPGILAQGGCIVPSVLLRRGIRVRVESGALLDPVAWSHYDGSDLEAKDTRLLSSHGCPPGYIWLHAVASKALEGMVFRSAGDNAGWIQASSGNAGLQILPPALITASSQGLCFRSSAAMVDVSGVLATTPCVSADAPTPMLWRVTCGPTSRFPSVVASGCALTHGRWYYEVIVGEPGIGQVRFVASEPFGWREHQDELTKALRNPSSAVTGRMG